MTIFNLPDLGEGLAEAEIREWYVKEGDEVKAEQPLVAVETAKALVDVPSPQNGRITKLHGKAGDIIKTGAPLVAFEGNATTETKKEDKGTVVGKIEVGTKLLEEAATGITATATATQQRIKATPAVRALAKALHIDMNTLTGTGPGGAITLEDVKQANPINPAKSFSEPLRGVRRAMAVNMAQAHHEIVPVTIMDRADIQHWSREEDYTIRIIRAIILACKTEPSLNAHFDGTTLSRELFKEINLGLAVDTPDGLYVPVIKDVSSHSPTQMRETIEKFKNYAKKQSFPVSDLQNATITLSNFGSIAGRHANPIMMPPTVAIIGIGKASDEVVAVDGKPVIHRILPLSLTFDHRAVTGGEAVRFLAAMIEDMQNNRHHN